jgi:hypothetical protein
MQHPARIFHWRAFGIADHDAAVPLLIAPSLRDFAIIFFAALVPCVAGLYVIGSIARDADSDRA